MPRQSTVSVLILTNITRMLNMIARLKTNERPYVWLNDPVANISNTDQITHRMSEFKRKKENNAINSVWILDARIKRDKE